MIDKNIQAWSQKDVVRFYTHERTRVADLYDSESSMLLPVVSRARSVLDVGCAIGNFYPIFRELNPKISYTGIDIAEGMIQEARRRYPGVSFHVSNGRRFPFEDDAFDLVFCTGVLHHNPDYIDLIKEVFRVSARFCVIDLPRLVIQPYRFDPANSYMELQAYVSDEKDKKQSEGCSTCVPYVLANVHDIFEQLRNCFLDKLSGFACRGYYGKPRATVRTPFSSVIFMVCLLMKGNGPLRYCLSVPDDVRWIAEKVLSVNGAHVESVEQVICSGAK